MVRRVLVFVLVFLVAVGMAQAAGERQTVFRDLAWGDPVEALGDVVIEGDRGRLMQYRRPNEDLQLGPVRAFIILYEFFDGHLVRLVAGVNDKKALLDLMVARYGKPDYDGRDLKVWMEPEPDSQAVYMDKKDYALLGLSSISIGAKQEQWEKEQKAAEAQSAW